jgi:hypothetical protein
MLCRDCGCATNMKGVYIGRQFQQAQITRNSWIVTVILYSLINCSHYHNYWLTGLFSKEEKVHSKVIFDTTFAVVVPLIDILVSSFLPLIWLYISNYVVSSLTCIHNTDTTSRPILKITHIFGNVSVH